MNLRDTYVTLLRRGMPEHPRLRPCGGLLMHTAFDEGEFGGSGPAALHDDDTRDLLTMHAWRWACATVDFHQFHDFMTPERLLDAVLEATAHLEPKAP